VKQDAGGIMKNEMLSLLLDEKMCFIELTPDTLQNFWQINVSLFFTHCVGNSYV
jgi:hypothetical protein